jgi:D-alanyl-lipoteichoic acid acyltransferase DltB (MBOAT superfamily)
MGWEYILRFVIFGILHWMLAIMMLNDLANRKKVIGGKKWIWAVLIIFVFVLGSVMYLLFHPKIFFGDDSQRQ